MASLRKCSRGDARAPPRDARVGNATPSSEPTHKARYAHRNGCVAPATAYVDRKMRNGPFAVAAGAWVPDIMASESMIHFKQQQVSLTLLRRSSLRLQDRAEKIP